MGAEQQQEVKSLPRNRKCGNCRYFEPAPLWRKGWCRNPQLYPPHANHLVDSATIDCEGGFRSRIYWEPIPQAVPAQDTVPSPAPKQPPVNRVRPTAQNSSDQQTQQMPTPQPGQARSGAFGPRFNSGATSPQPTQRPQSQPTRPPVRGYRPNPNEPEVQEIYYGTPVADPGDQISYRDGEVVEPDQDQVEMGTYTRTSRPSRPTRTPIKQEQAPARPVRTAGDWREGVRRNFTFTENWNLEAITLKSILPWVIISIFALFILLVVVPSNRKNTGIETVNDPNATVTVADSTADSSSSITSVAGTPAPVISNKAGATTPNSKTPASGAASNPGAATTTAPASNSVVGKAGTVNSADGINVRKDPTTTGAVVTKLKKGDKVTIVDGPKNSDGRDWYQVKVGNNTGWVAKEFIDIAP